MRIIIISLIFLFCIGCDLSDSNWGTPKVNGNNQYTDYINKKVIVLPFYRSDGKMVGTIGEIIQVIEFKNSTYIVIKTKSELYVYVARSIRKLIILNEEEYEQL